MGELLGGCLESFGQWILGVFFLAAALVVALRIPSAENPALNAFLAYVLFHTAAMLIIGFGLKKAGRFLAVSWVVVLVAFLGFAALATSG